MSLLLDRVSYTYPSAREPALRQVELRVAAGELVLLTGPTGCGKSTLLRLAGGLLQRHGQGRVEGRVEVAGLDPGSAAPSERVRHLGFVSQEPGDQLVAGTLGDELAFAMESAGFSLARIEAGIAEGLARSGLPAEPERSTRALSGGQTQRLVTEAALCAGARVLLLDEPLAQLDPAAARSLMQRLRGLADEGVAVLLVEHRLEPTLPHCDRVVVMEGGGIAWAGDARELRPGSEGLTCLRRLGASLPGLLDLEDRLDGRPWPSEVAVEPEPAVEGPVLLAVSGLSHRWPGADQPALQELSLAVRAGERVALLGANGAGKSTLLAALAGELGAQVHSPGRRVGVPQDPDLTLFCPTVGEELAYGPREEREAQGEVERRVRRAAEALSVEALLERAPQALSRGQRLRVAVAAALSCQPGVLLLDEPTAGQDHAQVERMMASLRRALRDGALLFATHDLDLALRHATRVLLLDQGRLVGQGPPRELLAELPPGSALELPPLAAACLERGLPPLGAARLAEEA